MKVIATERVPIKIWATDLEDGALEQAKNLANLPFIFKHMALMPDAHQGYGMPIGGVLATKGVIIPNAVGVDIGCGMVSVKSNLKVEDLDTKTLKKIMGTIRRTVPVGFKHHKSKQDERLMPDNTEMLDWCELHNWDVTTNSIVQREYEKALYSIGTLGGGNHFIEIQKDEDNYIYIMLHSGSRNLGLQVAKHYNDLAKELNSKWYSQVDKFVDLAFLPLDTEEAKNYMKEMQYCVSFAFANRLLMINRIQDAFTKYLDVEFEPIINIAHNYARIENHFGTNVIVHRKGATSARKGEIGIIPGSMGTSSYIVEGLGNAMSFQSCSHGAGRKMGRKQAQKNLVLQQEKAKLDDLNIVHGIRHKVDLDEAPGAYKDINLVMENQKDLVKIITKLTPIASIKG